MATVSTRGLSNKSLSEPQLFSSFVSIAAGLDFNVSRDKEVSALVSRIHNLGLGCLDLGLSIIGRGSSFSVMAIPKDASSSHLVNDQLDAVAFKRTIPGSRSESISSKIRRVRDVMLELRVLCHDPIEKHENIVTLFGIAWENDPFSRLRQWPVLLLERASHGTLAEYLQTTQPISPTEKNHLGLDAVYGLEILHLCHVFHGDLKLENVLVFHNNEHVRGDRPVIAKLADFGGSLHDVQEQTFLITPTRFWAAPEARSPIDVGGLPDSDIYALGFLLWCIFANGQHPFLHGSMQNDESAKFAAEANAEALKATDGQIRDYLMSINDILPLNEKDILQQILTHTIRIDPGRRSLHEVRSILEANSVVSRRNPFKRELASHQYVLKDQLVKFDFQGIEALDQTLIGYLASELAREAETSSHENIGHEAAYGLAVMHINGIVVTENHANNIDIGLNWLKKAALAGNDQARAFIYRVYRAFERELPDSISRHIPSWLGKSVWNGFFTAVEDLVELGQYDTLGTANDILRTRYGGVGAKLSEDIHAFRASNTPYESAWVEQISLECWDRNLPSDRFGNRVLHLAALWGLQENLAKLLGENTADINGMNVRDETPLLLACRAGNYHVAMLLLEAGADPRIASHAGDGPLHWLISFDKAHAVDLCENILRKGVEIDAFAQKWKYTFPGDNIFVAGTPLMRAVCRNRVDIVKILLEAGASPDLDVGGSSATELAAQLHYPQVLALLLEHSHILEFVDQPGEEDPLLIAVLRGGCLESPGSIFGRLRRHGRRWRTNAEETLQRVIDRRAKAIPKTLPVYADVTSLVLAIYFSQPDIVKAILDHGGTEAIDICCQAPNIGRQFCTPLVEAIWMKNYSIFEMLLAYGADPKALTDAGDGVSLSLLYECARVSNADTRFARTLIKRGVPVNARPEARETPLACAIRRRCFSLARVLLDNGADINVEFNIGFNFEDNLPKTVLGLLLQECSLSSLACLEFIFTLNPNPANFVVNASSNLSVLHVLANVQPAKQDDRALSIILDLVLDTYEPTKAQIDLTNTDSGFTALHIAAFQANEVLVKRLIEEGADPNAIGQCGLSPFHVACYASQEFPRTMDLSGLVLPKQTFLTRLRQKLDRVVNLLEKGTHDSMHDRQE